MTYASKSLDNSVDGKTADRILFFIKSKGPSATARLAQMLEMTPEAARQQVHKLAAAGLIEGRQQDAAGVGRPRQHWVLTEAGNRRFPDTHAQMTVQLIGSIRQLFGEEGLDKLVAQRESEARALYQQACGGATVPERLEQLAAVRTGEGYMARIEADAQGWLLIEDHCPICAAARTCQGFCRSELQLFSEIAGPGTTVIREQHVLAGATRCVYRIVPA
ncbi:helix-turn-helix transcriptional regulator [Massilia sp. P8910]|uniref:helix-turn-helix transcriptional regulator n=1 Tax=Massilia antarctica TaxID=2765360 RepID=UPI001E51AEA9|nr:helix-turn-helix transcriptional regulator [Massilia antarctica]MCE3608364.1 helix-turn-helix transcriptional regulator [Massilia antarctica]